MAYGPGDGLVERRVCVALVLGGGPSKNSMYGSPVAIKKYAN